MTERTKFLLAAMEYERKRDESNDPKVQAYYEMHRALAMAAAYAGNVRSMVEEAIK